MKDIIILQSELQGAISDCIKKKDKAQKSLNYLCKLADYPTPTTLNSLTIKYLTDFVTQRVKAVESTPIYTQDRKDSIIADWVKWKVKAMPNVETIENFVKDWSVVCPTLDTDTMTITTNDIAESLTPLFTKQVPEEAVRHISLIADARNAINNLRDFEKLHDIKKTPLANLLQLKEEILIQSWINGSLKVDYNSEDERTKVIREAVNAVIL